MARDLIPPPSPAGRPRPAGTPLLVELPPDPLPGEPVVIAPETPLPPASFRNRFGFLIGALAGALITAAVLVAVIVTAPAESGDAGLAPNWSRWQPSDTSIKGGAAQIAAKVGAAYKHANGQQIVNVTGNPLEVPIALRPAAGAIQVYDGRGAIYQLNGLGPNGSIKDGAPSEQRQQLMRREALELALYTFRYLPDVELVVALLPPPPPQDDAAAPERQDAIFYRPGDLKRQLQVPLGDTVAAPPPTPERMGGPEGETVDKLTEPNLFHWSLTQAQDQTPYLVLDRPSS